MASTLRYILATGAAALALGTGAAEAATPFGGAERGAMPLGRVSPPPPGFLELCERTPEECLSTERVTRSDLAEIRSWASRTRWQATFSAAGLLPAPARPAAIPAPAPRPASVGAAYTRVASGVRAPSISSPPPTKPSKSQGETGVQKAAGRKQPQIKKAAPRGPVKVRPDLPGTGAPRIAGGIATPVPAAPPALDRSAPLPSTRLLQDVNRQMNRAIRRASDTDAFGREDLWVLPTGPRASGDCEDYVLAKRRALIEAGVAPTALSIAIVRTRRGETHAVLLVATDEGEHVLDNLSPWVLRWDQAPYEWLERQVPGQALNWVTVGTGRAA